MPLNIALLLSLRILDIAIRSFVVILDLEWNKVK